jgi:hypothetical protein
MKRFFKIYSQQSSYNAVIETTKNGGQNIYVGGNEYVCVEISSNDVNIKGDVPDCYINSNFPNRTSDAKNLMRATLYLLQQIEGTCKLTLTDMSDKKGDNLTSYYIAFHRKTWYQNFNAVLNNNVYKEIYDKQIASFESRDAKISNNTFKQFLQECKCTESQTNQIMLIYNKTLTYKDFFDNLKTSVKKDDLYTLIRPWITNFVDVILQLKFVRKQKWIISCPVDRIEGFKHHNLENDPYNGKYTFITKKSIKYSGIGGGLQKKYLTEADKRSFRNPRWIGWKYLDVDEYNNDDKKYLLRLIRQFEVNP